MLNDFESASSRNVHLVLMSVLVFIIVVSLVGIIGIVLDVGIIKPGINEKTYSLLSAAVIASSALVAVLTYAMNHAKNSEDSEWKKQNVLLKRITDSYDEVFGLLEDCNNNRVEWVRAARILLMVDKLKKNISIPEIRLSEELATESLRVKLYKSLAVSCF